MRLFLKQKQPELQLERTIPLVLPDADGNPLFTFDGEVVENLRQLITRIGREHQFPRRLALVAALRGEGVTYLSWAMAATLANDMNAQVCVVDLNWWWPSPFLSMSEEQGGIAAVVTRQAQLEETIIATEWPNLSLIPSGVLTQADRPKIVRSERLGTILNELEQRFDYLILDIPALLSNSDSVPLASLAAGCCLVIRQGATRVDDVRSALDYIKHIPVYGVILNQEKISTPKFLLKLISPQ